MINEDILGWITLCFIIFIFFLIIKKDRRTINFLVVALFLRSLFVILDQYFLTLPDSDGDAFNFEKRAIMYSEKYGIDVIFTVFSQDSFFISRIISLFYTLLDRSELMAKMFSVGIGTGAVYLIYCLSSIIWGNRVGLKAAWFATLFPSFVLYSALILREVYVVFFLTYALIGCVNFINKKKFIFFLNSFLGFFIAALFHGPMIIGFFVFIVYIFFIILKQNYFFLRFKKKNIYLLFLLPILLLPIITYFMGYYSIPKIGNISNFGNIKEDKKIELEKVEDRLIWKIDVATRSSGDRKDGAGYPSWTVPTNIIDLIYLAPVRMTYFLYSPFPWDIKRQVHLIGLLDVIFYIYLSLCIFRNRKIIFDNPQTKFLFIILLVYIFAYSFGVGNFGIGIRHRLKFIGVLVSLASPLIVRFKLTKIK